MLSDHHRSWLRGFGLLVAAAAVASSPASGAPKDGEPLIVTPGSAPAFRGQQGREADITELLARAEQTGGAVGIFRQTIAPGNGPPTHLHEREGEFAYVVSGDFKFRLGERVVSVPVGSFVFIPRRTPHAFKNVGSEPGVLLFGVSPGGFERMFEQRQGVDATTNAGLMKEHKMKVVGPPIP